MSNDTSKRWSGESLKVGSTSSLDGFPCGYCPSQFDSVLVEDILECEQESGGQHTLADFW
jgi:hypothetical protein